MKTYYNEDIQNYLADPQKQKDKAKMYDSIGIDMPDCIPVGINNTFMATDKFDSSNLEKTEYNIRERFGHLQGDDY